MISHGQFLRWQSSSEPPVAVGGNLSHHRCAFGIPTANPTMSLEILPWWRTRSAPKCALGSALFSLRISYLQYRPAPFVESSLRLPDSGENIGTRRVGALPKKLRSSSKPLRPASRSRPSADNHPRPTKVARWALRPSRRPALIEAIIAIILLRRHALRRRAIPRARSLSPSRSGVERSR